MQNGVRNMLVPNSLQNSQQNSIEKIVSAMPAALISAYEKKSFYTADEVAETFASTLETKDNIEYAYAMFCTLPHFVEQSPKLNIVQSYSDLRLAVSKECFGNWPRFNFDSLLEYSQRSMISDGTGGFGGGEGCGDGGGCGGE